MIGDGIFTVTLAVETLHLDPRPLPLSIVLAARLLPTILLILFGGVLVDRMPRRMAMLFSDATRGLAVAVIAVLVWTNQASLWQLIVMAAIFGAADALFYPASTAVVSDLLPRELFVQGNALNRLSRRAAMSFAGPALGGVVVGALGTAWGFAFDALSFLISAGSLLAIRARPRPAQSGGSLVADAIEGLRYVRSQPWLWATLVTAAIGNFAAFSPLAVLVPLLVRRVLNQGALALGLVFASGGLGGIVSALLLARIGAPRRRITTMWLSWSMSGASIILIGLAPQVWLVALAEFLVLAVLEYGSVLWYALMQDLVPTNLLGRASSVDWLVSLCLSPLGVLAAGFVAGAIGTRNTIVAGGVVAALGILVLLVPGVRDPERR
jgi:MFS transporter, DHA3 family, tetracycline resistance protein